jgi:succinoglycan biosynthesis transport protein ExoP
MDSEAGLQIDLFGAARRQARLIASVIGISVLAAYWISMALPNEYTAAATLLIEPQSVSEGLVEAGVAERGVNERLQIMTSQILSRPRLSRIIDELDLYPEKADQMRREEIINLMRENIHVTPVIPELQAAGSKKPEEINNFIVAFTHGDAETSAAVAQRLANDFIQEHIAARVQLTQKSLEFISAEQSRITNSIQGVEQRIAQIKDQNSNRLPEDLPANQRMLERALGELRSAERQLDLARSDEAFWAHQATQADVGSDAPRDDASPGRKLQLLELSLAEYNAKGFTEKHPDVLKVKQEMAEVRAQIAASQRQLEKDEKNEEAAIPSPARQTAEAELDRAKLRVEAAEKEQERLRAQIDEIYARIAETPRVAERLDALTREHAQLNDSLRDFSRRQLEATVQAQLERRQLGEQFRILEAAYAPSEPSSPNRPLIIVLGLIAGVGMAGGIALVRESTDTSVHGARDLQSAVSIPVLASIPAIVLDSDRRARMRRNLRYAMASAVVVVFSLAGGAATYVFVNGQPGWLRSLTQGEQEQTAPSEAQGASLETDLPVRG